MTRRLLRSGIEAGILQVVLQMLVILTGILLARNLGPAEYGVYSFTMAVVSLLILVAQLGFPSYSIREISVYRTQERWQSLRSYISYSMAFTLLSSILISFVAFVFIKYVYKANEGKILAMTFGLTLVPISVVFRLIQSNLKGFQKVSTSQLFVTIKSAIFLILCLFIISNSNLTLSPVSAILMQTGAVTVVVSFSIYYLYRILPIQVKTHSSYQHNSLWFAGAVSFTMLSGVQFLNTQVDILTLGVFRSDAEVALYRVASQGSGLLGFGLQIAIMVAGPEIAKYYANGNLIALQKLVNFSTKAAFGLSSIGLVVIVAYDEQIISFLFGPEYLPAKIPLMILAIGKTTSAFVGCAAITLAMCGYQNDITKILIRTSLFNLLFNMILVPGLGAVGAAIATSFVFAISSFYLYKSVRKEVGINAAAFDLGSRITRV